MVMERITVEQIEQALLVVEEWRAKLQLARYWYEHGQTDAHAKELAELSGNSHGISEATMESSFGVKEELAFAFPRTKSDC